jgi:hypothetical protein
MPENNNEKKRFGRRAGGGIIAAGLITIAFYVCLFADADLAWLKLYTTFIVGVYGFVVGGLTLTDLLKK